MFRLFASILFLAVIAASLILFGGLNDDTHQPNQPVPQQPAQPSGNKFNI